MTRKSKGKGRGWYGEPFRHGLARHGIKTAKGRAYEKAEREETIIIKDNSNATKEYLGFEKRRQLLNEWGTNWGIELDESEVDSLPRDMLEKDLEAFIKKEFMTNRDEYIEEINKEGVKDFIRFGETKYEDILLNQLQQVSDEDIKRWFDQVGEEEQIW